MNIAITVWGNRISPVFDSAQTLLIAEVQNQQVLNRSIQLFQASLFKQCLNLLQEQEVGVLICGALCEGPVRLLESQNIEVIPFVTGEAEQILEWYIQGRDMEEFAMPGCNQPKKCCRRRRHLRLE